MTDSPTTGKKSNLTIQSLPPLISDTELQGEVGSLFDKALVAAEFARGDRNKRIAHQDRDYLSNRSSDPLSGTRRKGRRSMY